ncbi:MAG: ribbon-helix-helix protein, CopG family [bacterium]
MRRTQIYLTEEEREALRLLSEREGRPMSELIREAVDRYIARRSASTREEALRNARGIWRDRDDLPDFERLRAEFDRLPLDHREGEG